MAADLIHRGLDVGTINSKTYDNHPYRRLELMRALLNTLELSPDGMVANWEMRDQTRIDLALLPGGQRGPHRHHPRDPRRAARGVFRRAAGWKNPRSRCARRTAGSTSARSPSEFGGGGHALAAGIRMKGPLEEAKALVLGAIRRRIETAGL